MDKGPVDESSSEDIQSNAEFYDSDKEESPEEELGEYETEDDESDTYESDGEDEEDEDADEPPPVEEAKEEEKKEDEEEPEEAEDAEEDGASPEKADLEGLEEPAFLKAGGKEAAELRKSTLIKKLMDQKIATMKTNLDKRRKTSLKKGMQIKEIDEI